MLCTSQGLSMASASPVTSSYTQAAGKQFSCLTGGGSSSNGPVELSSQSFQPLVSLPSAPMSFATSPVTSAMNGGAWCPDSGASHHVTYDQSNLQSGVPYAAGTTLHQQSFPLLVSQSVPGSTSSVPPVNLQESTTSLTCESSSEGLPLSSPIVDSQQNVDNSGLERPLEPELVSCPGAEILSSARAEPCPASPGGLLESQPVESQAAEPCPASPGGLLESQPVESQVVSPCVVTTQHNVVESVLEGSLEPEPEPSLVDGVSNHEQSEASQQSARVQDDSFQLESVAEQSDSFRQTVVVPTVNNDLNVHSMVTRSKSGISKSARLEKQGNVRVREESYPMENSGEFPAGLRILIVDDDITCLFILETMLRKLRYQVTKCQQARQALALLREDETRFDIVLCDLHMPGMDGLKLLEIIGLEMDLPVVMMSSDDEKGVVMKGIFHGACDYLLKPIQMESVRLIWQHIVRRRKNKLLDFQLPANNMPVKDEGISQSLKRSRENEEEDRDSNEGVSSNEVTTTKKRRVIWTQELHEIFVAALNQLDHETEKAYPKKILERMQAMNVTGLSRAHIASHLQKYRLHLQKGVQSSTHPSADHRGVNPLFEQVSSSRRFNRHFQSTAGSSPHQLPLQNLVISTQQPSIFDRANGIRYTGLSHDQLSNNIYDLVVPESTHCLPTELSLHDLSQANLLFQNNVAILNEEELYRNIGGNVAELAYPISDGGALIY
ncbi:hypothetical protein V6N13_068311 [Hibiscus sabdariffa]